MKFGREEFKMKAIVLAAGKGERLGEITAKVPKPMIEIMGRPILAHNLEWLKASGIREFYINLCHLPEKIVSYFGDGSKYGMKIKYSYEDTLLGTAGRVRKIVTENFPETQEPFLVVYGD